MAAAALRFALDRHAGQLRDADHAPFVLHPLEVGSLLSVFDYSDPVIAAGVLHDVLEGTATDSTELESRFGRQVARLVEAVSEDASIEDDSERKAALRRQVARAAREAAAIFAADKVSKTREIRLRLSTGSYADGAATKLPHYRSSLEMLERKLGADDPIVQQLRFELEALEALPPG